MSISKSDPIVLPNVACENCLDAWADENIEPPCFVDIDGRDERRFVQEKEPGVNCCWIPDITDDERRVLELRNRLVSLAELHIGAEILKMNHATAEDIEMIAAIEDELRVIEKEKGRQNQ